MLLNLLLLMAFDGASTRWVTEGTEVFRPIMHEEVVINEKCQIYIVNRQAQKIMRYDTDGSPLPSFGKKGQGPGEFIQPTWIHIMNDKVYVEDRAANTMTSFTLEGKPVNRVQLVERFWTIKKVVNGWVYGDWDTSKDTARPVRLYLADDDFKNPQEIISWPRLAENTTNTVEYEGNIIKMPMNPAVNKNFLTVNPEGTRAFLIQASSTKIHVIDARERKVIKVIDTIEANPVEFNPDWGDAELKLMSDGFSGSDYTVKFMPDYPKYFPFVRGTRTLPDGKLVVNMWTYTPSKTQSPHIFNSKLKKTQSNYSEGALERLVGIHGTFAYVSFYDKDLEEGRIACINLADVNKFVAENPIEFDGLPGKYIATVTD